MDAAMAEMLGETGGAKHGEGVILEKSEQLLMEISRLFDPSKKLSPAEVKKKIFFYFILLFFPVNSSIKRAG
jgi:hypothetical protein